MILRQHLKAINDRARVAMNPQHLAAIRHAIADLKTLGVEWATLKPGQRAPDFALPDARGGQVNLGERLSRGPVVVSFYRGGWCPYCCAELRALQLALPHLAGYGATLIAVSPELPDNSLSLAEKEALDFDILTDLGNIAARAYGLVFHVPDYLRATLLALGVDLARLNGDDSWELPIPATFLLSPNGIIRLAFADADHTERLDPSVILELLAEVSPANSSLGTGSLRATAGPDRNLNSPEET